MAGYSFGVKDRGNEFIGNTRDFLDLIAGETVGGPLEYFLFKSKVDRDIHVYAGDGSKPFSKTWPEEYIAVIFTMNDEKVKKVEELEKDFEELEKIDHKLSEAFEKARRSENKDLERLSVESSKTYGKLVIESLLEKYKISKKVLEE